MRRPLANAALALSSVVATLLALELGARRFADPTAGNAELVAQGAQARANSVHLKSDDPELVYVTRPDYTTSGVRISEAHGVLQSTDVVETGSAGVFRVAVLGDSIAAAHPIRVGREKPFGEHLQDLLNASPRAKRVEVLNFGTDGYGTQQEARLLETRVAPFAPDLVIVAYCLNDPSNSYTPTVWFLDHPGPRSYLLDLVKRRLGLTPSELSPAHPRYTHGTIDWDRLYLMSGAPWQGVEDGLARIANYARGRGGRAMLVLFPLLYTGNEPSEEHERAQALYAQMGEAAARHDFVFVDLRPAFSKHAAAELRLIEGDPIHPNARGHREAAEAIRAAIEEQQIVP
jgi:lysophospholipase L1-like esterase